VILKRALQNQKEECHHEERRMCVCARERESLLSSDDVKQMKRKKIFFTSVPFDFFFSLVCPSTATQTFPHYKSL